MFLKCCFFPLFLALLLGSNCGLKAQDTIIQRKPSFLLYPVGFYGPETGLGLGFASGINFFTGHNSSLSSPSQVQFGAAFTEKRQLLFYLPFDLYFQNRKHQVSGEAGYYDYVYYFFGTSAYGEVSREFYKVRAPRIRLQYTRKLKDHFYAGIKGWYDRFDIYGYDPSGILQTTDIPGASGGTGAGPGLFLLYDSRDHVNATRKGWFAEVSGHHYTPLLPNSFGFDRYRTDLRFFGSTGKITFAAQYFLDIMTGTVPFFQMTGIGGPKRFRGYIEGRYRGRNAQIFQVEMRHTPFRRWGYVFFGGLAQTSHTVNTIAQSAIIPACGAGIRYVFDPEKRVHLRLDAAIGQNSSGIYFTLNEAF